MRVLKVQKWPWYGHFLAGAAIGAVLFCLFYGVRVLDVTNVDFMLNAPYMDPSHHLIGWMGYRNGAWQFPFIGMTDRLVWPDSVSVIYTDAIPGLAVFFKLLSPLLPETFQYFGLWGLFCYAMQGGLAALLGRRASGGSLAFSLMLPAFYCTAPILLQRLFEHTALGGQWLILLCIAVWAYLPHFASYKRLILACVGLSVLSVLTHLYLMVMVMGLMVVMLVNHAIVYKGYWQQAVAFGASVASALFIIFILGGFNMNGGSFGGAGLGELSANLNTFYNSQGMSRYLFALPMFQPQYEGLGYLGLGLLFLVLVVGAWAVYRVALAIGQRRLGKMLAGNLTLLLMAFAGLVFFLVALSPVVTYGQQVLFTVPLPGPVLSLLDIFRNTGRFVWPVIYLLMYVAPWLVCRATGKGFASLLLAVAVLLQVSDLSPSRNTYAELYKTPFEPVEHIAQAQPVEAIIGDYAEVFLVSGELGGGGVSRGLAYYAMKHKVPINATALSRRDNAAIAAHREAALAELEAGTPRADTLYVFYAWTELPWDSLHYYQLCEGIVIGLAQPTDKLPPAAF